MSLVKVLDNSKLSLEASYRQASYNDSLNYARLMFNQIRL